MKKVWGFILAAALVTSMLAGREAQKQAEEKKDTAAQTQAQTEKESTTQKGNTTSTEVRKDAEKVIVVIPKSLLFDCWQYVRTGAQSAGLNKGYAIGFQGTKTGTDLEDQVKLIEDFIQKDVLAIVISPVNPDDMVPVLQQAEDVGVPVIITDGKLNTDFPRSTVSTNDEAAGKLAMEKLRELAGDAGGTFVIVSTVPGAVQEDGRKKGFSDELGTYPDYKIIGTYYGKGDRNQAYNITQDILTSNPNITGLYTVNESSSVGVTLGVREEDLKEKIFVAFDPSTEVLDAIRDGYVDSAVTRNPYLIRRTTMLNAIKVSNDETVEKKVDVPVTWVTIDNLDDLEIRNILKPKEVIEQRSKVISRRMIDLALEIISSMPTQDAFPGNIYVQLVSHKESKRTESGTPEDPFTPMWNYIGMVEYVRTHVDAFFHMNPRGLNVGRMPLDMFFGKAVCLDMTHVPERGETTAEDMEKAQEAAGAKVNSRIVLLVTGTHDKYFSDKKILSANPEITPEAVK